jgi:hypothetical protein
MKERFVDSWSGQALLVAMVLVAGAIGFCLFDGFCFFDVHEHGATGHGMSLDLCAGLAIFSVAMSLVVFAQVHSVAVAPLYVAHPVFLHRLDPPPRSRSLS